MVERLWYEVPREHNHQNRSLIIGTHEYDELDRHIISFDGEIRGV